MNNGTVLLVDDDGDALLSLSRALKASLPDCTFHGAGGASKALALQAETLPQVAIIDLCLVPSKGVASGFELLEDLKKQDPTLRIIVLTGHGSVEHGVTSIQKGAASFLEKPANVSHLAALVRDGIAQAGLRRVLEEKVSRAPGSILSRISGVSSAVKKLHEEISFAAFSGQPVFITGESGTGKGLCAAAIHELGKQKEGKFVRYQPSYLSGDLVNSDLFGHVKGSFTGADGDRKGLIEEASGGTLFLDEVDALPPETQVLLLGVLQDKKFRKVGGNQELVSSFRLISASNANIPSVIEEGKFRKDLFYRLGHLSIHIAPLRERKEDIEPLIESFLEDLREREELSVCSITPNAVALLKEHGWPGNIRELQAVIEGASYRAQFANRFEIDVQDIRIAESPTAASDEEEYKGFHEQVYAFKLKLLKEALSRNGGNQLRAANELGLDRTTMRRLLARSGE